MNIFISRRIGTMKLIIRTGFAIGLFTILIGNFAVEVQAQSVKEMTIEVQSRIIALPGGAIGENIAKVPLSSARVRNTELRDLNKYYHVVSIERIYEVANAVAVSADSSLLKSNNKKKKKLMEKRLLRKTSKGFFESTAEDGKISADKAIKLKKKRSKSSKNKLVSKEPGISEEDITAMSDMFILGFKDYVDTEGNTVQVNMDEVVVAYNALEVVVAARKN